MIEKGEKPAYVLLLVLVILISFLQCCVAKSQDFNEKHEVASAIYELTKLAPARKITKNNSYRLSFARDLLSAARKYNVPELLLTVKIYNESSFRMNVCSSSGLYIGRETCGLGQMHGVATEGCDLSTRLGQLECSAKWLQVCYQKCGTWTGALSAYGTRGYCSPMDLRKPWSHVFKYWKTIRRQISKWLLFEEQRQAIRDTIIDDIEYYNSLKE